MAGQRTVRRPAHRPSRRRTIIDAAIRVFARDGYVDASVDDIAREAGVVPTTIYYHFGGKEELFHEALRTAMDGFTDQVVSVRPTEQAADEKALRRVIRTGWDWWTSHPDHAMLIARYSQGSTGRARPLRDAWEERHVARAYDYLQEASNATPTGAAAREQHAAHGMRVRLLFDVILAAQEASLPGEPLGRMPKSAVEAAVEDICARLITG